MTSQHPALGIDYGEARIGIAATDPVGIMAHPVETIHRHKTDGVTRIVQLVQERGIRTLVLGIPVRMDGTEGTAAAKVRAFGRELAAALPGLPMVFMDECLTTVIAQEKLHAAGKKEKSFRPIIDQVAVARVDFERHGPGIRRHGGYGTLEQLPLGDIEVLTACRIRAVLGPQDDDAGRCSAQEPALDLALAFRSQGDPVVEDGIGNKQ